MGDHKIEIEFYKPARDKKMSNLDAWKGEHCPTKVEDVPKERASAHCLQKWKGTTKENLRRFNLQLVATCRDIYDKESDECFLMDASTCALCYHHFGVDGMLSCGECPLAKYLGGPCTDHGEPYNTWLRDGDPLPMIKVLEALVVVT